MKSTSPGDTIPPPQKIIIIIKKTTTKSSGVFNPLSEGVAALTLYKVSTTSGGRATEWGILCRSHNILLVLNLLCLCGGAHGVFRDCLVS